MFNKIFNLLFKFLDCQNSISQPMDDLNTLVIKSFNPFFQAFYEAHQHDKSLNSFLDFMINDDATHTNQLLLQLEQTLSSKILKDIDTRHSYSCRYLPSAYFSSENNYDKDVCKQQKIIKYLQITLSSYEFLSKVSNEVSIPLSNESKDKFLNRSSQILKELLCLKFTAS